MQLCKKESVDASGLGGEYKTQSRKKQRERKELKEDGSLFGSLLQIVFCKLSTSV